MTRTTINNLCFISPELSAVCVPGAARHGSQNPPARKPFPYFPFAFRATSIAFQSSLLQVFGMQTLSGEVLARGGTNVPLRH